jgi:hypothetical protein
MKLNWVCVAALAAVSAGGVARAETFVLAQGGQIEGTLKNPDEVPRENYVIQANDGTVVTLARAQVKQVVRRRPVEVEYDQVRHQYPDTVEGQRELAEWCRERSLLAPRKVHLQRIIELDPDDQLARRGLGYVWKEGEWVTRQELMERDGRVWYDGKWRLPQEIALLQEAKQVTDKEKEWIVKIAQWRQWLGTDKDRLARENIVQVSDPLAAKALEAGLGGAKRREDRLLFVRALAKLESEDPRKALAACAVLDADEEVRLGCLDYLKKTKDPRVVESFVKHLGDKSNLIVNRAGYALGEMGDPSAIGPLIKALTTSHKRKVAPSNPGQTTAGMNSQGGMGLSVGQRPKIVTERMNNRAVLEALDKLTGVNFGFDLGAWNAWYASQKRRDVTDARRG